MGLKSLVYAVTLVAAMAALTADAQDAEVEFQCGRNVISTAVTSESGSFSMVLDPVQIVPSSLLNDCCLVLKTPLAACNSNLTSAGDLVTPLTIIGNTLLGILLKPVGFQSMPQSSTHHVSDKA